MVAHICLQPQLQEIQCPLQGSVITKHACDAQTHMQAKHSHITLNFKTQKISNIILETF